MTQNWERLVFTQMCPWVAMSSQELCFLHIAEADPMWSFNKLLCLLKKKKRNFKEAKAVKEASLALVE